MWTSIRNETIIDPGVKNTPLQKKNKKENNMNSLIFSSDPSRRLRGATLPDSRMGLTPGSHTTLPNLVGRRELGSRR